MRHVKLKPRLLDDISSTLRGNLSAIRHNHFKDTMDYYNFSQNELVRFEVPLQIRTVLEQTQASKVSVIAWSISSQLMFKVLASNTELKEKIHNYHH